MIKNIPNMVTGIRLLGAVLIIFSDTLSYSFFVIYTVCGFTDCIDGALARKLNAESKFGAKLDTIADLAFYTVMMCKMLPIMWMTFHKSIFVLLAFILIVRALMYQYYYIKNSTLDSPHTVLNKITGAMVFLIPYAAVSPVFEAYCWCTCLIALAAIVYQINAGKQKKLC